jgi:hypothetical protein
MSMLYGDGQIRGYNQADRRSDLVPSYLGIDALGWKRLHCLTYTLNRTVSGIPFKNSSKFQHMASPCSQQSSL